MREFLFRGQISGPTFFWVFLQDFEFSFQAQWFGFPSHLKGQCSQVALFLLNDLEIGIKFFSWVNLQFLFKGEEVFYWSHLFVFPWWLQCLCPRTEWWDQEEYFYEWGVPISRSHCDKQEIWQLLTIKVERLHWKRIGFRFFGWFFRFWN